MINVIRIHNINPDSVMKNYTKIHENQIMPHVCWHSFGNKCNCITCTLSRNKRLVLDEKLQQNASKFAILLEYENPYNISRKNLMSAHDRK